MIGLTVPNFITIILISLIGTAIVKTGLRMAGIQQSWI